MSDELKPCPGCGSETTYYKSLGASCLGASCFWVTCSCGWQGSAHATREGARAAWNRRAQPTIPEIPERTPPIDPDLLESGEEPKR
jgi:hypothetical protein